MSQSTKLTSSLREGVTAVLARKGKTAAATRKIRLITGVREETLDVIPAERTRYTAMAAVMICTATFGGFSMYFALSEVTGSGEFWFVPLAIFWSLFVLCVDCWLISSSVGTRWRARASMLLPRLLVAMFIGAFIAEPLVLRVFETAIVTEVHDQRQQAVDTVLTALVACNPVPGALVAPKPPGVSCQGMTLNIASPAAATVSQLAALRDQANALQGSISQEEAEIQRQENRVNAECNGTKGNGLTGVQGDGPACRQDQQYLAQYLASNPVDTQKSRLTALNSRITGMQATVSAQQSAYRSALGKTISARVAAQTAPNSTIGMGERFQALGKLSLSSDFIGIASWFVRIFFILIDSLPVLVKFISGTTPYDRLAQTQTAAAERIFARKASARENEAEEEISLQMHAVKARTASRRREIDLEALRYDAAQEALKEDAVDELWRRKVAARKFNGGSADHTPSDRSTHNGTGRFRNDDFQVVE